MNNFTGGGGAGIPESAEKAPQVLFHRQNTTIKNNKNHHEAFNKTNQKQKLVEDPLGLLSENEDFGPKTAQKKKEIKICLELEEHDDE